MHDYRKIDTDATRCKALKSKAHFLGRCYWRHNTSSSFCATTIVYHLTTLTLSFSNITSTFALYHHHIFSFFNHHLGRHHTSYLWRIDARLSSVHFVGNCRYLVIKLLGCYCRDCPCLGKPSVHLASVSDSLWRALLALSRTILDRAFSFMCFISSADTPQFEHLATTSYRQLLSPLLYILVG